MSEKNKKFKSLFEDAFGGRKQKKPESREITLDDRSLTEKVEALLREPDATVVSQPEQEMKTTIPDEEPSSPESWNEYIDEIQISEAPAKEVAPKDEPITLETKTPLSTLVPAEEETLAAPAEVKTPEAPAEEKAEAPVETPAIGKLIIRNTSITNVGNLNSLYMGMDRKEYSELVGYLIRGERENAIKYLMNELAGTSAYYNNRDKKPTEELARKVADVLERTLILGEQIPPSEGKVDNTIIEIGNLRKRVHINEKSFPQICKALRENEPQTLRSVLRGQIYDSDLIEPTAQILEKWAGITTAQAEPAAQAQETSLAQITFTVSTGGTDTIEITAEELMRVKSRERFGNEIMIKELEEIKRITNIEANLALLDIKEKNLFEKAEKGIGEMQEGQVRDSEAPVLKEDEPRADATAVPGEQPLYVHDDMPTFGDGLPSVPRKERATEEDMDQTRVDIKAPPKMRNLVEIDNHDHVGWHLEIDGQRVIIINNVMDRYLQLNGEEIEGALRLDAELKRKLQSVGLDPEKYVGVLHDAVEQARERIEAEEKARSTITDMIDEEIGNKQPESEDRNFFDDEVVQPAEREAALDGEPSEEERPDSEAAEIDARGIERKDAGRYTIKIKEGYYVNQDYRQLNEILRSEGKDLEGRIIALKKSLRELAKEDKQEITENEIDNAINKIYDEKKRQDGLTKVQLQKNAKLKLRDSGITPRYEMHFSDGIWPISTEVVKKVAKAIKKYDYEWARHVLKANWLNHDNKLHNLTDELATECLKLIKRDYITPRRNSWIINGITAAVLLGIAGYLGVKAIKEKVSEPRKEHVKEKVVVKVKKPVVNVITVGVKVESWKEGYKFTIGDITMTTGKKPKTTKAIIKKLNENTRLTTLNNDDLRILAERLWIKICETARREKSIMNDLKVHYDKNNRQYQFSVEGSMIAVGSANKKIIMNLLKGHVESKKLREKIAEKVAGLIKNMQNKRKKKTTGYRGRGAIKKKHTKPKRRKIYKQIPGTTINPDEFGSMFKQNYRKIMLAMSRNINNVRPAVKRIITKRRA